MFDTLVAFEGQVLEFSVAGLHGWMKRKVVRVTPKMVEVTMPDGEGKGRSIYNMRHIQAVILPDAE